MSDFSVIDLFLQASLIVQIVMILLLMASIISWIVIFERYFNLNRIKEASKSLLSFDATNTALFTSPDIKPCIRVQDNDFTIGSYVEVIEDYTAGYNRPSGCGYVIKVNENTIDVKYSCAHDGG